MIPPRSPSAKPLTQEYEFRSEWKWNQTYDLSPHTESSSASKLGEWQVIQGVTLDICLSLTLSVQNQHQVMAILLPRSLLDMFISYPYSHHRLATTTSCLDFRNNFLTDLAFTLPVRLDFPFSLDLMQFSATESGDLMSSHSSVGIQYSLGQISSFSLFLVSPVIKYQDLYVYQQFYDEGRFKRGSSTGPGHWRIKRSLMCVSRENYGPKDG